MLDCHSGTTEHKQDSVQTLTHQHSSLMPARFTVSIREEEMHLGSLCCCFCSERFLKIDQVLQLTHEFVKEVLQ